VSIRSNAAIQCDSKIVRIVGHRQTVKRATLFLLTVAPGQEVEGMGVGFPFNSTQLAITRVLSWDEEGGRYWCQYCVVFKFKSPCWAPAGRKNQNKKTTRLNNAYPSILIIIITTFEFYLPFSFHFLQSTVTPDTFNFALSLSRTFISRDFCLQPKIR
jgi:hypothetical protein